MMTCEEIRTRIESFSARGLLDDLCLRIEPDGPVRPNVINRVRATVTVPDVNADLAPIIASRIAVIPANPTPEQVDRAVWAAVVETVCHEAGESLLRDGVPVFDPHARPRMWPWNVGNFD
ncbi:MAG: hypothetical protein ABL912_01980 [Novosphingobium sp.]